MKLLYVTDLHGDTFKYNKILNIAIKENIKLIINGGDILPKYGNRHQEQPKFINGYLRSYFRKLEINNIKYLVMLGNDDLVSIDNLFKNLCLEFDNVFNIDSCKVEINGFEFIGMNYILDHPFGCKDRVVIEDNYVFQDQLMPYGLLSNETSYDKILNWIEYATTKLPKMKNILNSLPKPNDYSKTIYITHIAPANLKLGQLYYQDLDIGSVDIYNFIEKNKPLLTLHGHIHESPDTLTGKWINNINDTTCINTGQTELNSNKLIYAAIDLQTKKYERIIIKIK